MQVVTSKPISRWQIWLGKWLGILGLNAMLLVLAGTSIFILLKVRASHLPVSEQKILQNEIFVARASVKERPPNLQPIIDANVQKRIASIHEPLTESDIAEIRKITTAQVTALTTEVPSHFWRPWAVDLHTLSDRTRNSGFQIRLKFHTPNPNTETTYDMYWVIGPTNSSHPLRLHQVLPPESYQEFFVPPHLLDESGVLHIEFYNANDTSVSFPIEDGFELMYFENTFGVNFIRGIAVIFFWLALLAAIGLAAASQLSFPVAAFVSMAILLMGLSSGTLQSVVEQGTITGFNSATSSYGHSPVDLVFVPVFRGALKLIKMVEGFSPIDFLSTGRSITWTILGEAFAQIVLLTGGVFCVIGIVLFSRRELAAAQSNQ